MRELMNKSEAVEIPLIKATNETLKGYGYLIDSYENSDIEIVTWPKQGWRNIDEGTGNEGGSTEGSFDAWWEGSTLYGQNNAVQHNSDYEVDGKYILCPQSSQNSSSNHFSFWLMYSSFLRRGSL